MFDIEENIYKFRSFYKWSLAVGDKRVETWPLMQSPVPTLCICSAYLLFVSYGPLFMKSYKPFNLNKALIVYNLSVMFLNIYIVCELATSVYYLNYSWFCEPVSYSDGYYEVKIVAALWWYYISKLIEFLDTAFFILRKKNDQLTFLHVYHHSTMLFLWWIGVKYVAGGSSVLAAMTNSFVHVLMYTYYGLSAFGPGIRKYLWWKKYLTCIQMVQFASAGILGIRALIVGCDFPLWMQYALVLYMGSFVFLFGRFFSRSYCEKTKKLKKA